jgi:hypothetical protein
MIEGYFFAAPRYVRFWHKADMRSVCSLSAFGGKADIKAQIELFRF